MDQLSLRSLPALPSAYQSIKGNDTHDCEGEARAEYQRAYDPRRQRPEALTTVLGLHEASTIVSVLPPVNPRQPSGGRFVDTQGQPLLE
jgi:hypothetical protein